MKLIDHPRITIDPNICNGKPVITGTRVMVHLILSSLTSGQTKEEILSDYPNLKNEDIVAALAFATDLTEFQDITTKAA